MTFAQCVEIVVAMTRPLLARLTELETRVDALEEAAR